MRTRVIVVQLNVEVGVQFETINENQLKCITKRCNSNIRKWLQ